MNSAVLKPTATSSGPRPGSVLLALLLLVGVAADLRAQPAAPVPAEAGERSAAQPLPPPSAAPAEAGEASAAQPPPPPPSTARESMAEPVLPPGMSFTRPPVPIRLEEAIRQSLANVETVQANVALQTATVARFEALKEFIPLVNLPQLAVAFNQFAGKGKVLILPDVTGGALLEGSPGLQQASLNRANLFFPMTPSGHITALPIAEEGIHLKWLMEQLVRRSQMMLAIQDYYEAKQIDYGIRTARLGVELAVETRALTERKLREKQVHDVELTEARVTEHQTKVLLSDLEKDARIRHRELASVLHQSRLLTPQEQQFIPIELEYSYGFDLADPDEVDLRWMPDFPGSRAEAIQLAKQQRVDVRIRTVGLRIARIQQKRSILGLFGEGRLPAELGFKNTNPGKNGGITLGAIFGSTYGLPVVDIGLWSSIREARLDVVKSQLELEQALLEVAVDAGNAWDNWQQAIREWELSEHELELRHELVERMERLHEQKQSIWVEVLGTRVNLLQGDANRWTRWYNLQLARFNVLRSTEQLLDYVERTRIARMTDFQKPPEETLFHSRWKPWASTKKASKTPSAPHGGNRAKK
ncbi:MAG: TolC family protein [Isosphaeraceae bacterium]